MSKLEKVGYYNKETGEGLDFEIVKSVIDEENRNYYKSLFIKYKQNPENLDLKELSDLRLILMKSELRGQKDKSKVYLKYSDGFYMVALNTEDNLRKLSIETNGVLHLLGFHINKSGIIIYKNNRPIRSFEKLREYVGISDRVWRRIKIEIDNFDVIRKDTIKGEVMLVLNPKYSAIAYEVTEYKFLVFSDYFKENLTKIDYLYLVKQFQIDNSCTP